MNDSDDSWLLRRERGGDVSHVPASTRARYEHLAELIRTLPGEAPSPAWQARVIAEIDEPAPRENVAMPWFKRRCAAWLGAAVTAMTASGAVVIASRGPVVVASRGAVREASAPTSARGTDGRVTTTAVESVDRDFLAEDTVTMAIRRKGKPVRAAEVTHTLSYSTQREPPVPAAEALHREFAHVGDTLLLHVKADPALELRVYGDAGEPLARCAAWSDCTLEMVGNTPWFRLEVPLKAPGRVSALLFPRTAIPTSFHNRNTDFQLARASNATAREVAIVFVK